jgi:CarD family transcriptional regulator
MSINVKRKEREKQNMKMGAVDENYMRRAESLLYGELSIALEIPASDVPGYIAKRVETHALRA